jgi:DUF2075 family protein
LKKARERIGFATLVEQNTEVCAGWREVTDGNQFLGFGWVLNILGKELKYFLIIWGGELFT